MRPSGRTAAEEGLQSLNKTGTTPITPNRCPREHGPADRPRSLLTTPSVPELPHAGEHHRDSALIGGGDYLGVLHRAPRLDDGAHPRARRFFYPVGERKERVGS